MANTIQPIPRDVAIMRIVVSLLVLGVGLAVLTSPNMIFPEKFEEASQKIAAGWVERS